MSALPRRLSVLHPGFQHGREGSEGGLGGAVSRLFRDGAGLVPRPFLTPCSPSSFLTPGSPSFLAPVLCPAPFLTPGSPSSFLTPGELHWELIESCFSDKPIYCCNRNFEAVGRHMNGPGMPRIGRGFLFAPLQN